MFLWAWAIGWEAADATEGRMLFTHQWAVADPLSPAGDGLGPQFNDTSCAACHHQGGVGGAGDRSHDAIRLPRHGLVHHEGRSPDYASYREGLFRPSHVPQFGCGTAAFHFFDQFEPRRVQTPALFGSGLLDAVTEAQLEAARVAGEQRGVTGRIGRDDLDRPARFGWKANVATLEDFVHEACAQEIGLTTPLATQAPDPTGTYGTSAGPDLDTSQVRSLVTFVASLPRPPVAPDRHEGRAVFVEVGCAACHAEQLGDVQGAYTDLLLHDMGFGLSGRAGYGSSGLGPVAGNATPSEWRTPPLWGVASSAPYLHDGRAPTLVEAIEAHGGEADSARERFEGLQKKRQRLLVGFLQSLTAPE